MKLQDCITMLYDDLFNLTFNKSDLKEIEKHEECAKVFGELFPGFTFAEFKNSPYIVIDDDELEKLRKEIYY